MIFPGIFAIAIALGVVDVLCLDEISYENQLCNEAHREVTSQPLRGNLEFVGSIAVSLAQCNE